MTDVDHLPSARQLAWASGLACAGAAVLLAAAVLPAEYGIDPLGTGRLLGLTAVSGTETTAVPPPSGDGLVPERDGLVTLYPGAYRVDTREFTLGPYEYLEFKYRLAKDATMVFSWRASGDVMHDFHGDPDGGGAESTQSYDKKPRRQADGSFTAPFAGIHGWFWENPSGEPITVRVQTAGFYTEAWEFDANRKRHRREVTELGAMVPANASKE